MITYLGTLGFVVTNDNVLLLCPASARPTSTPAWRQGLPLFASAAERFIVEHAAHHTLTTRRPLLAARAN